MTPEQKARLHIDELLTQVGWSIQDMKQINLSASLGVAVREYPLNDGFADYLLFIDRTPIGVIEAKAVGITLSGVADQSEKYRTSKLRYLPHQTEPLRFAYESTGIETFFRDAEDIEPKSRRVFTFHTPEILQSWFIEKSTLRNRLKELPELNTLGLRNCQIEAITNLEESFSNNRERALIQMATGSGKTFTAVSFAYRLIKFAKAKRILFLVDRNNLGRQTKNEFNQYITPDDGRKFVELYNVQHLQSNTFDPVAKVCVSTIQRLFSMIKGEELDPNLEEFSNFDSYADAESIKEVGYNPKIPIDTFDFIITDECHRSIYNQWRQVLEYFDAFLIGLTATPSKQTIGFFNQNLVMEYNHERAVADGVNVGFDVYEIKTKITKEGSKIDAGFYIDKREKQTRKVKWEKLDQEVEYKPTQLDRDIVSPSQIRTIIQTFKEKIFTEIFPNRKEVPKTLVFAKDDSHAEDIVNSIKEIFGKGNDFVKKITYRTANEKPEDLLASFRNSYFPRIAVTVDMIATGTDIRPLECILFMRDVRSRTYFEQMIGRGTRTISSTDLMSVTPDALTKTHFVAVDAIGVFESIKVDTKPTDRKPSVPLEKILISVASGNRDEDTILTLAGRLSRIEKGMNETDRIEIKSLARGKSIQQLISDLFNSVDADKQEEKAKEIYKTETPTEDQLNKTGDMLIKEAVVPFDNYKLRDAIIDIKKKNEQIIDTISIDEILFAGGSSKVQETAKALINSFKDFIEKNKDEIIALQIIYSRPYSQRHITFEDIKTLAEAIRKPPYNLTPELLWHAFEQLEKNKVKGAGAVKLLTNIISLIRFAVGQTDTLEPYPDFVERKFNGWLTRQNDLGKGFSGEQEQWLKMIKEYIAASVAITLDDFDNPPFFDRGGRYKAYTLFGENLLPILAELNQELV